MRLSRAITAGTVAAATALALAGCGGSNGHSGATGGGHSGAPGGGKPRATASGTLTGGAGTAAPSPPPPPPQAVATAPPPSGGLPSRIAADGTTIVVGDPSAPHTVVIEEDPRCPYCKRFENANGARLGELAKAGTVQLRYVLASFLDNAVGGNGSHRAVNALRAAVQENRFPAYHQLLYSHQPPESTDGFTAATLLNLAGRVPGLSTAAFRSAVTGNRYIAFVNRSEAAFLGSGATATPTLVIDGTTVTGDNGAIFTASGFAALLASHGIR